jgi:iron complex outermembrane recepter protein
MQKKQLLHVINLTMKLTFTQLVLSMLFTVAAFAGDAKAQGVLDKLVTINAQNIAIKKVIAEIKSKTAIEFIYSSSVIQSERKISITANKKRLGDVLTEILVPLNIGYKLVNDQVLLYNSNNNTVVQLDKFFNTITGTVTNSKTGEPLVGVTVSLKGKNKTVTTDAAGKFSINADEGDVLVITSVGYNTYEAKVTAETNYTIVLASAESSLDQVSVIGSRSPRRVATETAVPVDILNIADLTKAAPQSNLNQILNYVAPSFTSNTQTVADGTDHIDPAQLRGLGPDQVLVLLNGKRRHSSSLVNVNGTPGRGSVGTDLNAIPAFAIERIEVLRDGAAAQYGSDAIAGVINVVMKKNINKLTASLYAGGNASSGANDHRGGLDGAQAQLDMNYGIKLGKKGGAINLTASLVTRGETRRATDYNGQIFNAYNAIENRALAGGVNLSSLFGNINNNNNTAQIISTIKTYAPNVNYFSTAQQSAIAAATTLGGATGLQAILSGITDANTDVTNKELAYRGLERRNFNMRVGQSRLLSGQIFMNTILPVNDNITFYTFGGYGVRNGNSAGFYRRPVQANTLTEVYPNGFLPEIVSHITDASLAIGLRGKIFKDWNFDISNTYGQNQFKYTVNNTINATQGINSPKIFNAGKLGFGQNTVNLDLSHEFNILEGLNLAFGGEARMENYKIVAGDENSYGRYDIFGNIATSTTNASQQAPTDFFGGLRGAGAQVFPGFRAGNAVNESRTSVAGYADVELNVSKAWLVSAALRYENYSDFGSTFSYKFATRVKVAKGLNFRGAIATGFRAPSLQQRYFNSTSTQFIGGLPFEVASFKNNSKAAEAFGIPSLKQEDSYSYSAGFTYKVPQTSLTFTIDGYYVKIKNRIVLTGQFLRPVTPTLPAVLPADQLLLQQLFDAENASRATFFTNAINTESKGIDYIVSNKFKFDGFSLKTDLAGTVSVTKKVGDINSSDLLKSTGNVNKYFDEASRIYLESAVPRSKLALINTLTVNKFEFFIRHTYFGSVTDPNTGDVNGNAKVEGDFINGQFLETEHPVYGGRTITDFSIGYAASKTVRLTIGANNIFDIYPDLNLKTQTVARPNANGSGAYNAPTVLDLSNNNQFEYSRNVSQFGFNGRFIFARLNISL